MALIEDGMRHLVDWLRPGRWYSRWLGFGKPRVERLRLEPLRIEQLRRRATASASARFGEKSSLRIPWPSELGSRRRRLSEIGTRIVALSERVFSREDETANDGYNVDRKDGSSGTFVDWNGDEARTGRASATVIGGYTETSRLKSRPLVQAVSDGRSGKDFPERPSLEDFGRLGTHYLLSERLWVRRHVETAELKNLQSARRKLTIDIMLPRNPGCAVSKGDHSLYFMPVTLLAKRPITAYIDLVDENDRSQPLLTREENATVSFAAVIEAGRQLLGGEPPPPLRRAWAELIKRDDLDAALALHIAEDLIERWYPEIRSRPDYFWFERALRDLAANSLVWMALEGQGGERRIVKLRCEVAAGPAKLRPQRDTTIEVTAVLDDGLTHTFEHTQPGDGDPRTAPGRVINRIGNTLGLTAMSVALASPSIRGSSTYHLQFEAPPGLEVQRLKLLTHLRRRRGAVREEPQVLVENDWDSAHLYMTGGEVSEMQPAVAELRVGRRGFLSLSTLSGMLIVAMLWAYDAAAPLSLANSHPEVAGAVLLVVPVMLLAFVVRQGEHPYASRMLAGVRACMLTLGLLAVADAAAIVAVKPAAWNLHHTWFVYAVAGSVVGGALALGWLLALRITRLTWGGLNRLWESRAVYAACCIGAGALTCVALGVGDVDTSSATTIPALGVGIPLFLALACWTLIATPAAREAYPPAGLCYVSGAAAIAASGFLLEGDIAGLSWHWAWTILAPTVVFATLALVLWESSRFLAGRTRARNRGAAGETS
jgi:hypothetical protein